MTATTNSASKKASLPPNKVTGQQRKTLNLNTYKDHALGDYVETIRHYGTVDSYSTESVSTHLFVYFLQTTGYIMQQLLYYRWSLNTDHPSHVTAGPAAKTLKNNWAV